MHKNLAIGVKAVLFFPGRRALVMGWRCIRDNVALILILDMETAAQLKCTCGNCGEIIEYSPEAIGHAVECPKCKEQSLLPNPPTPEEIAAAAEAKPVKKCPICGAEMEAQESDCPVCDSRSRLKRSLIWGVTAALVLLGVGWLFLKTFNAAPARRPLAAPGVLLHPQVKGPKSLNDLRVGKFSLQRRSGSNLVIATGDVENISENIHLRVRVDLDVLDAKGAKIGTVSAIAVELRPHSPPWHFLEPVSTRGAASVKFAGIKEDQ
ncbi:MAG: hypothetical protein JWR26_4569 [Pedosphaera sp.]|nr:hypothetical protein [Pedosphaera sp.]